MIEINLMVSSDEVSTISDSFKMNFTSYNRNQKKFLFIISVTEEDLLLLTLKYGKNNVWKR